MVDEERGAGGAVIVVKQQSSVIGWRWMGLLQGTSTEAGLVGPTHGGSTDREKDGEGMEFHISLFVLVWFVIVGMIVL